METDLSQTVFQDQSLLDREPEYKCFDLPGLAAFGLFSLVRKKFFFFIGTEQCTSILKPPLSSVPESDRREIGLVFRPSLRWVFGATRRSRKEGDRGSQNNMTIQKIDHRRLSFSYAWFLSHFLTLKIFSVVPGTTKFKREGALVYWIRSSEKGQLGLCNLRSILALGPLKQNQSPS